MKMAILGASASGKTSLAYKIFLKTKIKTFDLDEINWESPTSRIRNSSKYRESRMREIAKMEEFIIEGVYYDWTYSLLNICDRIVFIKIPYIKICYRLISRYIKRKIGLLKDKKDKLSIVFSLIKRNRDYNKRALEALKVFETKFIILKTNKDIRMFIEEFMTSKN